MEHRRSRCKKAAPKRYSIRDNIYIWRRERKEFVSMSNFTLGGSQGIHSPPPLYKKRMEEVVVKAVARVIAVNMLPYITYDNTSGSLGGYLGEVWGIIEKQLNIRSTIVILPYQQAEESILDKRADIMLSASVAFKAPNIEFTQPLFLNWYHMYMRKPEAHASTASYLGAFDVSLWLASISLLVVLAGILYASSGYLRRCSKGLEGGVSVSASLLAVFGGILNQGCEPRIKSLSGRFLMFDSLVFGYLIYNAMNAVLVSKLTIFNVELPFNSLEDVAVRRSHSLCVRTNNYVYKNFTLDGRILMNKWLGIVNGDGCLNLENQQNIPLIICNDNIAILENRLIISTIARTQQLPCELAFAPTKLFAKRNTFIILKNYPNKKRISIILSKLRSFGLLQRIEHKWMGKQFTNNQEQQQLTSPVTLRHVKGLFTVLIAMMAISMLVLAVEIFVHSH